MGHDIDPNGEIVVTCGSTEAMMAAMMTVANPGDKVVIFGGGPFSGREYFRAGVGTMICMHLSDDYRERYEKEGRGNVIVCDHMGSDSIGMNVILHKLEEMGAEVTRVAGIFNDR